MRGSRGAIAGANVGGRTTRGFTLIELGIVIAVVAVLAVAVVAGTGFMTSSRIAKGHEFVGKLGAGVSTLAGRRGGTLEGLASATCPGELISRQLAPPNFDGAGAIIPGWSFDCNFDAVNPTRFEINVITEDRESAIDLEALAEPANPGAPGQGLSHCRVSTFLPVLRLVRYRCDI